MDIVNGGLESLSHHIEYEHTGYHIEDERIGYQRIRVLANTPNTTLRITALATRLRINTTNITLR
jgi:hypothetical protein